MNDISTTPFLGQALSIKGASFVPVHSDVPTASYIQGIEWDRGETPARPLPAHSIVTGIVIAGKAIISTISISNGVSNEPENSNLLPLNPTMERQSD